MTESTGEIDAQTTSSPSPTSELGRAKRKKLCLKGMGKKAAWLEAKGKYGKETEGQLTVAKKN